MVRFGDRRTGIAPVNRRKEWFAIRLVWTISTYHLSMHVRLNLHTRNSLSTFDAT